MKTILLLATMAFAQDDHLFGRWDVEWRTNCEQRIVYYPMEINAGGKCTFNSRACQWRRTGDKLLEVTFDFVPNHKWIAVEHEHTLSGAYYAGDTKAACLRAIRPREY